MKIALSLMIGVLSVPVAWGVGTPPRAAPEEDYLSFSSEGRKLPKSPLSQSWGELPDDEEYMPRMPSPTIYDTSCISYLNSPLRPSSPFGMEGEFGEVGALARPGPGVPIPLKDRTLLASAVSMAAHHTPPLYTQTLEGFKTYFRTHYPFPPKEERHTQKWETLETSLKEKGQKSFNLIGYGSLLDTHSSSEFATRGATVIAFGVKRFFGFLHPKPESSPLGMPGTSYEDEILRLNVKYTGDYDHALNGVLLEVSLGEELEALRIREKGYDLIKVPVVRFDTKGQLKMHREEAYILTLPASKLSLSSSPTPSLEEHFSPHMAYLYVCLRGAISLSKGMPKFAHFLSFFLSSTHVGDKKLEEWIKANLKGGGDEEDLSPRTHYRRLKKEWRRETD